MKSAIAAAAALLAAVPAMAEQLPAKRIFESPDISGPRARGVKLSPDGKSVTYIKTRSDDLTISDLWVADVAGGGLIFSMLTAVGGAVLLLWLVGLVTRRRA